MIIRTYGSSSYTDKESGENKCKYGPLYIHFQGKYLKAFDSEIFYLPNESLDYSSIVVDKDTLDCLKRSEKNLLSQMGVKLIYLFIYLFFPVSLRFLSYILKSYIAAVK